MLQELACTHDRVIGTKQTQRSLERGVAQAVYLANDADERIVKNSKPCVRKGRSSSHGTVYGGTGKSM